MSAAKRKAENSFFMMKEFVRIKILILQIYKFDHQDLNIKLSHTKSNLSFLDENIENSCFEPKFHAYDKSIFLAFNSVFLSIGCHFK